MAKVTLGLTGFTDAELLDIESVLEAGAIQRTKPDRTRYEAGALEPISATVIITGLALQVLANWLLKNRKQQRFRSAVRVEHPDGRIEERHIEIDLREAQTEEAVVRAVTKDIHV
jgi:hypothetical protein